MLKNALGQDLHIARIQMPSSVTGKGNQFSYDEKYFDIFPESKPYAWTVLWSHQNFEVD